MNLFKNILNAMTTSFILLGILSYIMLMMVFFMEREIEPLFWMIFVLIVIVSLFAKLINFLRS